MTKDHETTTFWVVLLIGTITFACQVVMSINMLHRMEVRALKRQIDYLTHR